MDIGLAIVLGALFFGLAHYFSKGNRYRPFLRIAFAESVAVGLALVCLSAKENNDTITKAVGIIFWVVPMYFFWELDRLKRRK